MADLSAMRAQLGRWRQELLASPVFVTGRPDNAAKAVEEANRLEKMAEGLKLILRELNSHESLLRARENQLRNTPPQQRYSAEQSLRQLSENVQSVRNEAQGLADLVHDLLDRSGLLSPIQKAKDLIDLAKDLDKLAGKDADAAVAQVLHVPRQTTLGPASIGGSQVTVTGVAGLIAFVYLGIKVLQKKYGSKTASTQ
jgi:hypothetical protein